MTLLIHLWPLQWPCLSMHHQGNGSSMMTSLFGLFLTPILNTTCNNHLIPCSWQFSLLLKIYQCRNGWKHDINAWCNWPWLDNIDHSINSTDNLLNNSKIIISLSPYRILLCRDNWFELTTILHSFRLDPWLIDRLVRLMLIGCWCAGCLMFLLPKMYV